VRDGGREGGRYKDRIMTPPSRRFSSSRASVDRLLKGLDTRMFQNPSTESEAQKGKTPRNASSPLRSSIDVYNGVPDTIQRQSHSSFSQARA
jgi:hypothetical protein